MPTPPPFGALERSGIWIYLTFSGLLLALSAAGWFRQIAAFPLVFGSIWALLGLRELLRHRTYRQQTFRPIVLVLGILLALFSPWVQNRQGRLRASRMEIDALQTLTGGVAPALSHDTAFGPGAASAPLPFEGRWTLINFWATWCPPCLDELPLLGRFAAEHSRENLQIVGFTRHWEEESPAETAAAIRQDIENVWGDYDLPFPTLVESERQTHRRYGVEVLPSTLLINPDARVVAFGIGEEGTRRVLALLTEELD